MSTVGHGIWQENWKSWKMRNLFDDLKNDEITEKREKWEKHTAGPGIWRVNWKSRKMRNTHFRTWTTVKKPEKSGKFRNVRCRTLNMAKKLKTRENKKHPLDDFKNEEITEKPEKWDMRTVGPGICRELKVMENEKFTL